MGESKTEKLNKLFDEWEKKQREEVFEWINDGKSKYLDLYEADECLKKIKLEESFTRDGIIDEEAWESGEKILFILKEANISKQIDKNTKDNLVCADKNQGFIDDFWFKDLVVNPQKDPDKDRIGRKIKMIGEKLSSKFEFKSVAYMNINKRGGLLKENKKIINGYLNTYYEFIKREIEIIDPKKIVVCCGKYDYVYKLKDKLVDDFEEIKLFFFYHPSALYVTNEKYIQGLNKDFGLKET